MLYLCGSVGALFSSQTVPVLNSESINNRSVTLSASFSSPSFSHMQKIFHLLFIESNINSFLYPSLENRSHKSELSSGEFSVLRAFFFPRLHVGIYPDHEKVLVRNLSTAPLRENLRFLACPWKLKEHAFSPDCYKRCYGRLCGLGTGPPSWRRTAQSDLGSSGRLLGRGRPVLHGDPARRACACA